MENEMKKEKVNNKKRRNVIIIVCMICLIVIIGSGIIFIRTFFGFHREKIGCLVEVDPHAFNSDFDAFVGTNKSYSDVRYLIDNVGSNNRKEINFDSQRIIQINYTSPDQEMETLFGTWSFEKKGKIIKIFGKWDFEIGIFKKTGKFGEDGVRLKEFDVKGGTNTELPTKAEVPATVTYKVTGYISEKGFYYGFEIVPEWY